MYEDTAKSLGERADRPAGIAMNLERRTVSDVATLAR